ncbi:kinesin-related protein 12 [Capsicum galapagoense]
MSRCFPYPPPGYSMNRASNEALIESIKLQKEREIAKAEKKERKREKKEKRREEKKAKKEKSSLGLDKATHESKGKYLFKSLEDEAELLERSNLTEEHGKAVCSQNSSCSSDSTQNSNKRKRPASPSHTGIQAHGSIIRIRLSKKAVQAETSASKEKHLLKPAQREAEVTLRITADRAANPLLKPASVSEPSTSAHGWVDRVAVDNATPSCSKVQENSIEFQYKNLIENWLPPSLQSDNLDLDDDDQSWLFQRKPKQTRVEEKSVGSNDTTCGSCTSLWPRAQYLQDVDLYALPYTVPF